MNVKIWTDGSSIDHKYGGWAAIIHVEDIDSREISGSILGATNNYAELYAVYSGISLLPILISIDIEKIRTLTIYTDSQYVINMLQEGMNAKVNVDIITHLKEILDNMNSHGTRITFTHTEAHSTDIRNKKADRLAYHKARRLKDVKEYERAKILMLHDLGMNDYQSISHRTSMNVVIDKKTLLYPVLGLLGEAGELANKIKKVYRDDKGKLTDERRELILDELGDILWYIAEIATELEEGLGEIAMANIEKLQSRQERGMVTGDGDVR